jgi:hypothetical protein
MARMVALVRALIEYGPTSRREIYLNPSNIVSVVPVAVTSALLERIVMARLWRSWARRKT